MTKNVILELLRSNGLSQRESKVYYAVLNNPNSAPNKLHVLAHISRTKIYEILSLLVNKNLISEELIGRKKVYRALNPEDSFNSIIESEEIKLKELKDKNQKLIDKVSHIYKKKDNYHSPFTSLEHLSDPAMIMNRFIFHLGNTHREILVFSKPPFIGKPKQYEYVTDNNVRIRTIMEYNPENPDRKLILSLGYYKESIRMTDELPLKLIILDEKVSILGLGVNNTKGDRINTIFIDEPVIAKFMKELFEIKWKQAIPLKDIKNKLKE